MAVLATLLVLGIVAFVAGRAIMSYPERAHAGQGRTVTVKVSKGMRFSEIADALAQGGVIDRPTWFRIYAMHRGLANKVRSGTFEISDSLPPRDVLELLVKGVEEVNVPVTIPEGKNLREVFTIIAQSGVVTEAELEAQARDPEWLKQQGIEGTVEGYLFPDTYKFKKPSTAKAILETMIKQHRVVWDAVRREHDRSLEKVEKQMGWGDREILIMASLVEKETADPIERSKVASVFYNRLTLASFPSRRLETDPTIRYGCTIPEPKSAACTAWDPAGRLHRIQLDDAENAYNTYQHPGLPPGPISNPGRASIAAAMAPDSTPYLFFVAKDERSHVFSKTFEEHQKNVQKYQK